MFSRLRINYIRHNDCKLYQFSNFENTHIYCGLIENYCQSIVSHVYFFLRAFFLFFEAGIKFHNGISTWSFEPDSKNKTQGFYFFNLFFSICLFLIKVLIGQWQGNFLHYYNQACPDLELYLNQRTTKIQIQVSWKYIYIYWSVSVKSMKYIQIHLLFPASIFGSFRSWWIQTQQFGTFLSPPPPPHGKFGYIFGLVRTKNQPSLKLILDPLAISALDPPLFSENYCILWNARCPQILDAFWIWESKK